MSASLFFNGVRWEYYQCMLMPAVPPHHEIELNKHEQKQLLKQSGALILRWTENWDNSDCGAFWFVVKDNFAGIQEFGRNTRSKIRRGLRRNNVIMIDAGILAKEGYKVYKTAFGRYKNDSKPLSEKKFNERLDLLNSDEYDFWGVYNNEELVAYCEVRKLQQAINTSVIKFHPDYLKDYTSHALFFSLIDYYLKNQSLCYITNGARNISHDTDIHNFLIDKFGFRKAYCKLNLMYKPEFGIVVSVLYPFRKLLKKIPGKFMKRMHSVLIQEYISRHS
ncbi:MAG: hypothetical protein R6U04_14300 [Bacteroidales bacterium]